MFSSKAIQFFNSLTGDIKLPEKVQLLNPYTEPEVNEIVKRFYEKFYRDENSRLYIFGINPGRFGGGLTGISFTDPAALREFCGIENNLGSKRELSSEYIYRMIEAFGGAKDFFGKCYLTALFPLALIKDGKNYNFYDDKDTFRLLLPFMKESVKKQFEFGARRDKVISLGLKNAGILEIINEDLKLFDEIKVLEHPRFIMQYKRKHVNEFINKYLEVLR